jgi:SAM-dependent methyltransferase
MDAHELSQLQGFEKEILSRDLRPAEPVGLRFDRLAREGWLPPAGRSEMAGSLSLHSHWECSQGVRPNSWPNPPLHAYWKCNCLAVDALLRGSCSALVTCEESWAEELPLRGTGRVTRLSNRDLAARVRRLSGGSSAAQALQLGNRLPDDKHNEGVPQLPAGSFDAVVVDSSVLLAGELRASLSEFRRVLRNSGRVVLLVANWEYEMEGKSIQYDVSFKRYRNKVYAGLVKRTRDPALEVEYICLLDPGEPAVRELVELPRDRLRQLGVSDVPTLGRLAISADVIKIPQATRRSIEEAGREAGFSRSVVAGAPGILASRLCDALRSSCAPERSAEDLTRSRTSSGPVAAADTGCPGETAEPARPLFELGSVGGLSLIDEICEALASSFSFVSATDNPHLLAVFIA